MSENNEVNIPQPVASVATDRPNMGTMTPPPPPGAVEFASIPTPPPPAGAIEFNSSNTSPDIGHKPASLSGAIKTLGTKEGLKAAGQGLLDPLQGIGEGALDLVHGIDTMANKAGNYIRPGFGDWLASPAVSDKVQKLAHSDNTMQSVGKGIEGIGEFFLGDEAFKSLSLAERMALGAKVAKIAESHPTVARIIDAGLNVVRTGTVSGAQSAAHGQSALEGAEYGAAGGVGAEALGAGADYLKSLTPEAKKAAADATAKSLEQAKNTDPVVRNFHVNTNLSNVAHSAVEDATGASNRVAENAGLSNLENVAQSSLDYNFKDAATDIKTHFNPVFDSLRESSKLPEGGNLFDIANNQIKTASKVLRNPTSVEAAESAQKSLTDGEAQLNQVYGQSGLSKDQLSAARAGWRKAYTLEELHDGISSALGTSKEIRNITGEFPATVNSKQLATRLNKAFNSFGMDKLQDALGQDGAKALVDVHHQLTEMLESDANYKQLQKTAQQILKENPSPQGKSSASAYIGSGALGAIAHFATASNPLTAAAIGVPATLRWLYTHPTQGTKILGAAAKSAASAAQAAKQGATHYWDESSNNVVPVDQNSNQP